MLHLTGTILLDGGREVREAWADGGTLTLSAPEGWERGRGTPAVTELRGVAAPGLVDVHCHVAISGGGAADSDAQILANARADLATGVTLARDCGAPVDASIMTDPAEAPTLPVYLSAARHIARPKRYIRGYARELEDVGELPQAVAQEARASHGWVKLVGDWIDRSEGADADLRPLWPLQVLRDAVAAAHENGARVTVHTFDRATSEMLLEAGVDGIEHGTGMDADQAAEAASRGVPVSTTLQQVGLFETIAQQAGTKYPLYAEHMRAMHARRHEHLAFLHDAGVHLLVGTDAATNVAHGSYPAEMAELARTGIDGRTMLDLATWKARRYLGQPALDEGAPADLVVWAQDPREDVTRYRAPLAVVRDGRIVAGELANDHRSDERKAQQNRVPTTDEKEKQR